MINQNWINNKTTKLLYTSIFSGKNKTTCGVVLLPGLSHSMCDLDYFMSKLARRLSIQDLYTIQVDFRGHGDSSDNFEDVSLDSLREDIKIIIDYFSNNKVINHIFCIGRGLSASLLAEFVSEPKVKGIVGITPYCISPMIINRFWPDIDNDVIDTADFFKGHDYIHHSDFSNETLILLNALGTLSYNIHGQLFSTKLIIDLKNYEPLTAIKNCGIDGLWLLPDYESENLVKNIFTSQCEYPSIDLYSKFSLPRNPLKQYETIELITKWIMDKTE